MGEIDSKLLAFFVEVTAFKSESFCSRSSLTAVPLQLGQHLRTFEGLDPFCEGALHRLGDRSIREPAGTAKRQGMPYGIGINGGISK